MSDFDELLSFFPPFLEEGERNKSDMGGWGGGWYRDATEVGKLFKKTGNFFVPCALSFSLECDTLLRGVGII